MHRHFKRGPASQGIDTNIDPTLSVEEEAILADVHSQAEIDLDNTINDVERVTEVAEVSTDATLVVNQMPEVGTVEESLIASVADMAVAGTDASSDDVLSITKDAEGLVSTEGVVATLQKIWASIVAGLKNMWLGIKHWLTSYFSTLDKNKKQAEDLLKKLDGMVGAVVRSGAKTSIMDMYSYGYSKKNGNDGSIVKLANEVEKEDERLQAMVKTAIEAQVSTMMTTGDSIIKGFNAYHGGDQLGELGNVADMTARNMQSYIRKLGITSEDKKSGDIRSATVGSMTLIASGFSKVINNPANTPETKIALLNKVRFKVEQNSQMLNGEAEINIGEDMTSDMLKVLVKKRLDFINWQLSHRDGEVKKLEEKSAAVEKACEEMLGRIKPEDQPGTARGRQMMPLATAYANWATQPAVKLMSTVARHNNYWLTVYGKMANLLSVEPEPA